MTDITHTALPEAERAARRRARRGRNAAILACQIGVLAILLGLWEWATFGDRQSAFLFGSPSAIWGFLVQGWKDGSLLRDTYITGLETIVGFVLGNAGLDAFTDEEEASVDALTRARKVVFSSTLEDPLPWANATLVREDVVDAVRTMKERDSGILSTIGSLSLARALMGAGLVDRFRVVMFPVITGATGDERIYDGYPDVALEMTDHRTFDGSIQLVEYRPRVLDRPPLAPAG